jgi:hypothetical protein
MDELFTILAPQGTTREEFDRLFAELEAKGIIERNNKGTIISKRMIADGHASRVAQANAMKRWYPPKHGMATITSTPQTQGEGRSSAILEADAEADADAERDPPYPPLARGGGGADAPPVSRSGSDQSPTGKRRRGNGTSLGQTGDNPRARGAAHTTDRRTLALRTFLSVINANKAED